MSNAYHDIAFTPVAKAMQELAGSRASYAAMGARGDAGYELGDGEAAFIHARDGFYLASVNADGWPYVQFRGGAPGFLRVLDATTLAWADFRGNQQFVSAGNVAQNDRVALFLMDYPGRRRLKLFGHLAFTDAADDPALAEALAIPGYKAHVARVARVQVAGFDWNCPQHIPRRLTRAEWEAEAAR